MPYLKMLWQTESPTPQIGSWDYWITKADDRPYNKHHTIKKVNNKICYYGSFIRNNPLNRDTLVISPDSDAVTMCHWRGTPVYTYTGTITDSNGIIWYYTHIPADLYNPSGESMIYDISSKRYGSNTQQAAQDLLDRIYAVPFQHDFNVGQTYNMDITCSNMTFARKAIGIFLFKFISEYGTSVSYTALSNNVDTILNHFFDSNLVNFISLSIERIGGSADSIRLNSFFSDDTNPHTSYRISAAKDTISGFDYYFGRFDGFTYQGRYRRTDILSDGTITYSTPSASIAGFTIGVRIPDSSTYLLTSSNIGIDL